jgi:hypothetical protein
MNSFDDLIALFDFDVIELLDEVFRQSDVQNTMIEFNQDQLQDGKDALGQVIKTIGGSPYRPYTVIIRKSLGLQTNKVDLKVTGEFYRTFKVVINTDSYEITADFEKDGGSILDNFSSNYDFLGLDDESLYELAYEVVLPRLGSLLRKRLGL